MPQRGYRLAIHEHAAQEDVDKAFGDLMIADLDVIVVPERTDLSMVGHHAGEGSGARYGIEVVESSIFDTLFDVLSNVVTNVPEGRLKEDIGERVAFERAEEEEPDEAWILAVHFEQAEGNGSEERGIIFAAGRLGELSLDEVGRLAHF